MRRDQLTLVAASVVAVAFAVRRVVTFIALEFLDYQPGHVLAATLPGRIFTALLAAGLLVWAGLVIARRAPSLPFQVTAVVVGLAQLVQVPRLRFGVWPLAVESMAVLVMIIGGVTVLVTLVLESRTETTEEV